MNNRIQIRTDFVQRIHVMADVHAAKFDAFTVQLLEQSTVVTGKDLDEAWSRAMQAVAFMRAEFDKMGFRHPPSVFAPFAIVTAVEHARESAKVGLQVNMLACNGPGPEPDARGHESRVRALSTALDQIEFLERSTPAVH